LFAFSYGFTFRSHIKLITKQKQNNPSEAVNLSEFDSNFDATSNRETHGDTRTTIRRARCPALQQAGRPPTR